MVMLYTVDSITLARALKWGLFHDGSHVPKNSEHNTHHSKFSLYTVLVLITQKFDERDETED